MVSVPPSATVALSFAAVGASLTPVIVTVTVAESLDSAPESLARFNVELVRPGRLVFHYPPSKIGSGEILSAVGDAGLTIMDLTTREAELEDIFLQLTRGARESGPDANAAQ